ncbi:MAG: hypothetical protein Q9157_004003 [Trypethelium eluteriae]
MAPVRRTTKSAAKRDTRLAAAANTSNEDLIVEEVKADKEQPCLPVDREQEVHETKPDHPMPFPLILDPHYVCTTPGTAELKHAVVAKVELTSEEKEHALKALSLVLQAACDFNLSDLGGLPSSLDRDRDIIWDWRSIELSANEYGAFAYGVVEHSRLRRALDILSYDWTPLDSFKGILSVRKKCGFQSRLTRALTDVIDEAMYNNELLTSLAECVGLDHRLRASVLTGTVEGVRTPCRCWRYTPERAKLRKSQQSEKEKEEQEEGDDEDKEENEEGARPYDRVQDFVLEVGMGDKTPELRALAESYIKRGTLCVMTVKMENHGELNFAWSYSLYRRGKARYSPGQVTTYDVAYDAQDVRAKTNKHMLIKFPARLTLFDFMPSSVLKKHGVTDKKDEKAAINLSMRSAELSEIGATLFELCRRGKSVSEHLEKLKELL